MKPFILYGMPGSLYTGKVRAYLRKQRIDFEERPAGSTHFREQIAPKVGRWIIPVLETQAGELIQDGADIINYLERTIDVPFPAYPEQPIMRAISHLFELFGGEGMLRPAMHYRWNFDEQNLDFLYRDFTDALAPGALESDAQAIFAFASQRMRQAAVSFGVNPQTAPLIEQAFVEFLGLFDVHLKTYPYLLGDCPTIGDYGLFAPLFAHLARDPAPSMVMKKYGPRVWRWVERMQSPEYFPNEGKSDLVVEISSLPQSLKDLMTFCAQDYLPEMIAQVEFANSWLASRPDIEGTNGLARPGERTIGRVEYIWRGVPVQTAVMPYRFYLLQRMQDAYAAADANEQAYIRAAFQVTGLGRMLDLRLSRRVVRKDQLEIWGPKVHSP